MKPEAGAPACNKLSQNAPRYSSKISLVFRLIFTPFAQTLRTYELGVFVNRMCLHSRTLLPNNIGCCCTQTRKCRAKQQYADR